MKAGPLLYSNGGNPQLTTYVLLLSLFSKPPFYLFSETLELQKRHYIGDNWGGCCELVAYHHT